MSSLSTLPKGDSAWLLRKSIQRIMQQVSVLETNIGSSTTGNSANTQVIFNDNGTLRGDTGLTFNKTTDLLTVGAATITGDLTVDTSTLKVDSANNRVGIGTATPDAPLDVTSAGTASTYTVSAVIQDGTYPASGNPTLEFNGFIGGNGYRSGIGSIGGQQLAFYTPSTFGVAPTERYRIAGDGIATWSNVGGVAGTAMTLNSTGLGVGAVPSASKFLVATGASAGIDLFRSDANANFSGIRFRNSANSATNAQIGWNGNELRLEATTSFSLATNGVENRINVDGSGNVGIGVTPSAWLTGVKALDIGSSGLAAYSGGITHNAYFDNTDSRWEYKGTGAATFYNPQNGVHQWFVAASGIANNPITTFANAAMTLDASGNLLVGKTTSGAFTDGCQLFPAGTISIGHPNGTGSGAAYSIFAYDGVKTGDITQNGTTGVLYNTVSDYRLKESVTPLSGGLARVSALKPSIYKWKSDGSSGEGFLAHELAEVVPFAVTGEKDAVNEDGSIKAQSIDMSRVVPILVAAIQELAAEVNALKNA